MSEDNDVTFPICQKLMVWFIATIGIFSGIFSDLMPDARMLPCSTFYWTLMVVAMLTHDENVYLLFCQSGLQIFNGRYAVLEIHC